MPRRGPMRAARRVVRPHSRMGPSSRSGALPWGWRILRRLGSWRHSRRPLLQLSLPRRSAAHATLVPRRLRGGGRRPPRSPLRPQALVRVRLDSVYLNPICLGRRHRRLSRGSRTVPPRGRRATMRHLPRSRARSRRTGEGGAGPPTRRASTSAYLDPLANQLRWGRCRGPCCRGRRRCRRRQRRGSHRRCRRLPLRRCPTKLRLSRGLHPACGPVFWPGRARRRGPFRPVPAEVAGGRRACSLRWRAGRFGEPTPGGGRSLGLGPDSRPCLLRLGRLPRASRRLFVPRCRAGRAASARLVGFRFRRSCAAGGKLRLHSRLHGPRGVEQVLPLRVPVLLRPISWGGVFRPLWSVRVWRYPWAICVIPSDALPGWGGCTMGGLLSCIRLPTCVIPPPSLASRASGIRSLDGRAWALGCAPP